jgi:hypothetical protein
VIEVSADRTAVLLEVKRLAELKPKKGSADDLKLTGLEKALEDFRLSKRQTKAARAELAQRGGDFDNRADSSATQDPIAEAPPAPPELKPEDFFSPPVDPVSLSAPPDDGIDF